tara:strand:+ start:373 stop:696 length:324 start_codon:yes stop_codon:yes gene_type:complete
MSSLGPSEFDWSMRSEIYRVFAETGASPTSEQLAASLHASPEQITAPLAALYDAHEIVPTSGGSGVWMANAFFGLLSFGDIVAGADHLHRPTVGVGDHPTSGLQDAH